jgi:hypothetical protein
MLTSRVRAIGDQLDAELRAFVGKRDDKHFLWQTCMGDRAIQRVAMWKWADPTGGHARMTTLVEVGDALDGHVGIVHGGFTAGLLDDVLGQVRALTLTRTLTPTLTRTLI